MEDQPKRGGKGEKDEKTQADAQTRKRKPHHQQKKPGWNDPVGFSAARQSCEPPSHPADFTNLFESNVEFNYLTRPSGMSMEIRAEGVSQCAEYFMRFFKKRCRF